MTSNIQTLGEDRPHLKNPLELYEKWQRFHSQVEQHLSGNESLRSSDNFNGYPRETARKILQSFINTFELSADELEPLGKALENGEIDFMRLPLDDIPEIAVSYSKEELAVLLFLLSRPYFLALRKASQLESPYWDNGICPLCSAHPAIATIAEGPARLLHCSWCGTTGSYKFTGCPHCGGGKASQLSTLIPEEDPGFRISACNTCQGYVKIIEHSVLKEMAMDLDLADMASLPLDIVAQDNGYVRKAPNPIGLRKME